MSTETAHKFGKVIEAMLAHIVEFTKKDSFVYSSAKTHVPLMAAGFVEINPELVNSEGDIATRATFEGIRFSILTQWEDAKAELGIIKERELLLRNEVVALFSDASKQKGTENVELEDGAKLKIVKKLNYNLDNDIEKVETALDKIEALGPEGKFIADRLVKWSADLSISEYNKLAELGEDGARYKALIDEVITIKEATPTVELVEPKAKK